MSTMLLRIALSLSLVVAGAFAQEPTPAATEGANEPSSKTETPAVAVPSTDEQVPQTGSSDAADPGANVVDAAAAKQAERRVLKPEEVPGEMVRLRTKADIKAELKVRTSNGQTVVFGGVIRNGKLIERIIDRRFVAQNTVANPRCGVRIWWGGDSDGFIFFRYSSIESVAITGQLTSDERAEIMRRLQAKRDGLDPEAAKKAAAEAEAKKFVDVEKLSPGERGKFLMTRFPDGRLWTGKHYRELRHQQVLENVKLSENDELFVKYYQELEQVRFHALRSAPTKKEEFEPGSAESGGEKQPAAEEPK